MKPKRFLILAILILSTIVLSGCSTFSANSWPGITFDPSSNRVFVAYNTGVFAVDANSGTQVWRYPAEPDQNKTFFASPALTVDGKLIVGGYDNILRALDAGSGNEVWTFAGASNRYIGSAAVVNEMIFAPNADERLYALDLDGQPIWERPFAAGQALWAKPAIKENNGVLYLTSLDKSVYAAEAETGNQLWKKTLPGVSVGTPILDEGGNLYLGTFANQVIVLEPTQGNELWKVETNGWVWSSPIIVGDTLYFGDLEGFFYAVNRTTGNIEWQIQPDGHVIGAPLFLEDQIFFGTESGTIYAVDLRGNIMWNRTAGGSIYSQPVSNGELVIVALHEADNLLVAYDLNGNQQWSFAPANQ
jgi:outer membrane protein assembly factor BamB